MTLEKQVDFLIQLKELMIAHRVAMISHRPADDQPYVVLNEYGISDHEQIRPHVSVENIQQEIDSILNCLDAEEEIE